jgi:hypothetical protein
VGGRQNEAACVRVKLDFRRDDVHHFKRLGDLLPEPLSVVVFLDLHAQNVALCRQPATHVTIYPGCRLSADDLSSSLAGVRGVSAALGPLLVLPFPTLLKVEDSPEVGQQVLQFEHRFRSTYQSTFLPCGFRCRCPVQITRGVSNSFSPLPHLFLTSFSPLPHLFLTSSSVRPHRETPLRGRRRRG